MIPGGLCVLYAVSCGVIMWGMATRTDWPVLIYAPAAAALITAGIFFRYLFEVFAFGRTGGKKLPK